MDEIVEFRSWLKLNRQHFRDGNYNREEVTELALIAGFSRLTIYKELSHFQDALQGSSFDNRAKFHIDHESTAIEMLRGKIDLKDQWRALYDKTERGHDYDDYAM